MTSPLISMIVGWIVYLLTFNILYFTTGIAALGYLVADIVSSFLFALLALPAGYKSTFYKNPYFHYNFSITLVEFLAITLIFIIIGLI